MVPSQPLLRHASFYLTWECLSVSRIDWLRRCILNKLVGYWTEGSKRTLVAWGKCWLIIIIITARDTQTDWHTHTHQTVALRGHWTKSYHISMHNFHFLFHFNSKTTGSLFTKFLHDVETLVLLVKRHLQGDIAFRFEKPEQGAKTVNFDIC